MPTVTIAFFGDIVGSPGRRAFASAVKQVREAHEPHQIIVNGENTKHGSGLHPDGYKDIRKAGADAVTLGDHWLRARHIFPILEDPEEPIARPANLSPTAAGKTTSSIHLGDDAPKLHIITVLGRLFMSLPADDPFACVDREIERIAESDPEALFLVEVHAEATSEKIAMTWHCAQRHDRRVVAVVGSHTHVQTADARIVDHAIAAITDLGMCGSRRSVIGRSIDPVLGFMRDANPGAFDVADQDLAATGLLFRIDTDRRIATEALPLLYTCKS